MVLLKVALTLTLTSPLRQLYLGPAHACWRGARRPGLAVVSVTVGYLVSRVLLGRMCSVCMTVLWL